MSNAPTHTPTLSGDLSAADQVEVDRIASGINLADSAALSAYGNLSDASATLTALSELLERSPTTLLAGKIAEIVAKLQDANPEVVTRKQGWFSRFMGGDIETGVRYQFARKEVSTLLEEANLMAAQVNQIVTEIQGAIASHDTESHQLALKIHAGHLFLERNPTAGVPPANEVCFDNPRERFARRLASMATLLSSNQMSLMQLKLARGQALDMLERFHEISQVLVPVWRQHSLAVTTNQNNSPEVVALATKAHASLIKSLSELKGAA